MRRRLPDGRYFGVDLAWGQRNRTGLAVLEAGGRLVDSSTARADAEITEFVRRHATTNVVAAVDAPLVVPNATGSRSCEC